MITITTDLKIADAPTLTLYSAEGQYQDTDLVLYADIANPSFPTAQISAQFAKYGPLVYQFNTPEDLGKALYALDPESTHDAVTLYKEELARITAREAGTLAPTDAVPVQDAPVPADNATQADTQFFQQQAADQAAADAASTTPPADTSGGGQVLGESTTTPALPEIAVPATTTPDSVVPDATSTPIDFGTMSTTTPSVPDVIVPPADVVPAIDISTTTP